VDRFLRKRDGMIDPIDTRMKFKERRFSQDQVVGDGCNHNIQNSK
jgi:hypothetical protein